MYSFMDGRAYLRERRERESREEVERKEGREMVYSWRREK